MPLPIYLFSLIEAMQKIWKRIQALQSIANEDKRGPVVEMAELGFGQRLAGSIAKDLEAGAAEADGFVFAADEGCLAAWRAAALSCLG